MVKNYQYFKHIISSIDTIEDDNGKFLTISNNTRINALRILDMIPNNLPNRIYGRISKSIFFEYTSNKNQLFIEVYENDFVILTRTEFVLDSMKSIKNPSREKSMEIFTDFFNKNKIL